MSIKFSILVPVYNREKYLPQLLQSISSLDYDNWELIIVNDASSDRSLEILQDWQLRMPQMQLISYQQNKNAAGARNEGLKYCTGDFVCLLDSDDLLEPGALGEVNSFLNQHPDIDVVVVDELKVNEQLNPTKLHLKFTEDYYLKKQALFRTAFGGAGSIIRTTIFKAVGGYDERMVASNDRVLSYKLYHRVKAAGIPLRLYQYREHQQNLTKTDNSFKTTAQYQQIIAEYRAKIFDINDHINDWEMVKRFTNLQFDHADIRKQKYANVILKCALELARSGRRKQALIELKKAEYLHPKPKFFIFKLLIFFGKKNFEKVYQNMNAISDYYYDDFMQVAI